jgi:hypothetical protein
MPERAEIEVVARAICEAIGVHYSLRFQEVAERAIEALDRVRDARGDDEAGRCGCNELLGGHRDECPKWGESPQGEDHEANTNERDEDHDA